nr:macrolide 2'-phosphotransferase [Bacillus alkalicellulosilyticus]
MNISEIRQLAKTKGLDIIEDTININESGVDFRVAHVKDKNCDNWILRVPRRPESMRHALQEKRALDIIHHNASFEVPKWSIFSDELIAYKQLSGVPAAIVDVEQQDYIWSFDKNSVPTEYYTSLGKVLAELHALPVKGFQNIGVENICSSELRSTMKQRMERVKEQYNVNQHLWDRWQSWITADSYWPSHVGVKHGDLHPGHLLIDTNNKVTGVIDWTEVGIADVSVDFISHFLLFGREGLTKLINSYDNAGGRTWNRMEEHIEELLTTSGITVAEYAQSSRLKEMHEVASQMLSGES